MNAPVVVAEVSKVGGKTSFSRGRTNFCCPLGVVSRLLSVGRVTDKEVFKLIGNGSSLATSFGASIEADDVTVVGLTVLVTVILLTTVATGG